MLVVGAISLLKIPCKIYVVFSVPFHCTICQRLSVVAGFSVKGNFTVMRDIKPLKRLCSVFEKP